MGALSPTPHAKREDSLSRSRAADDAPGDYVLERLELHLRGAVWTYTIRGISSRQESIMRKSLIVLGAILFASPVLAQTSTASPPAGPGTSANPGSPAAANSGPGSTGITSRDGTGASTTTNNPAGASNAEQPSRAAPNTGRGGGGGGSGGGG
jgi:hypothetical protein